MIYENCSKSGSHVDLLQIGCLKCWKTLVLNCNKEVSDILKVLVSR